MNAEDIILGQLQRERFSHDITRETLQAVRIQYILKKSEEVQKMLELPWWKRKLLKWLLKDFE